MPLGGGSGFRTGFCDGAGRWCACVRCGCPGAGRVEQGHQLGAAGAQGAALPAPRLRTRQVRVHRCHLKPSDSCHASACAWHGARGAWPTPCSSVSLIRSRSLSAPLRLPRWGRSQQEVNKDTWLCRLREGDDDEDEDRGKAEGAARDGGIEGQGEGGRQQGVPGKPGEAQGRELYPVSLVWQPPFTMLVDRVGHGDPQVRLAIISQRLHLFSRLLVGRLAFAGFGLPSECVLCSRQAWVVHTVWIPMCATCGRAREGATQIMSATPA